jgi:hypothetical protein
MTGAPISEKAASSFPENFVVGVTRDPHSAQHAQSRLAEAGFSEPRVSVLSGDPALALLDAIGDPEGTGTRLRLVRQRLHGRPSEAAGYIAAVRAGATLIAVEVHNESQATEAAAQLRSANADHVRYYGRWVIEDL